MCIYIYIYRCKFVYILLGCSCCIVVLRRMTSDEARAFHYAVYSEVQKVPYGKVTSYGQIARMIDRPQNPRQVGQSLKYLPAPEVNSEFNSNTVPWWRVIASAGSISPRDKVDGVRLQREKLESEMVEVFERGGKTHVDLEKFGWFPETEYDREDWQ